MISSHAGLVSAGGWFWYVGGVLLLAAVAHLAKGAAPAPGHPADLGSAVGLAAAAALAGVLVLVVPVLRWRQRVEVFDDGFVWTRLLGTRSVRRDEVRGVRRIEHIRRAGSYMEVEVQLEGGQKLSIAGVDGAEQLANTLAVFARSPRPR